MITKGAVLGSEPYLKCTTQSIAVLKIPKHVINKELRKQIILTEAAWRQIKL